MHSRDWPVWLRKAASWPLSYFSDDFFMLKQWKNDDIGPSMIHTMSYVISLLSHNMQLSTHHHYWIELDWTEADGRLHFSFLLSIHHMDEMTEWWSNWNLTVTVQTIVCVCCKRLFFYSAFFYVDQKRTKATPGLFGLTTKHQMIWLNYLEICPWFTFSFREIHGIVQSTALIPHSLQQIHQNNNNKIEEEKRTNQPAYNFP